MVNYIICYDITEDDTRNSVADICKNNGLERIQYSVFTGKMNRSELKALTMQFKSVIKGSNTQILIIPVCATCMKKRMTLVQGGEQENEKKENDPLEEEEVIVF